MILDYNTLHVYYLSAPRVVHSEYVHDEQVISIHVPVMVLLLLYWLLLLRHKFQPPPRYVVHSDWCTISK